MLNTAPDSIYKSRL